MKILPSLKDVSSVFTTIAIYELIKIWSAGPTMSAGYYVVLFLVGTLLWFVSSSKSEQT